MGFLGSLFKKKTPVVRPAAPAGLSWRVTTVTKETPTTVSFEVDASMDFKAGQFVLLRPTAAMPWRAYSFSRAPGAPLRLTVLTCIPGALGLFTANAIAVAAGVATVPAFDAVASIGWQIVYFSTCTVVLGVLSFNFAVKYLGPLNTMLSLNLIPVGVFAIEAALGQRFAAVELAGAALVVGALVVNNLYQRRYH